MEKRSITCFAMEPHASLLKSLQETPPCGKCKFASSLWRCIYYRIIRPPCEGIGFLSFFGDFTCPEAKPISINLMRLFVNQYWEYKFKLLLLLFGMGSWYLWRLLLPLKLEAIVTVRNTDNLLYDEFKYILQNGENKTLQAM